MARTNPSASAMKPTMGLNTTVCGLEMSILKNPASATRSVVKNVKLGTAKATKFLFVGRPARMPSASTAHVEAELRLEGSQAALERTHDARGDS